MKNHPSLNAPLSDVCIGTSAAPTYFPTHYFETEDSDGSVRQFNLTDGGVAANNPVRNPFDLFIIICNIRKKNNESI